MEPTAEQLQKRLTPIPVAVSTPGGSGLFRAVGDYGSEIFKRNPDGTYQIFNVAGIGRKIATAGQTPDQYGNYANVPSAGGQAALGLDYLKKTYGLDYGSLPEYNIADIKGFRGSQYTGEESLFFGDRKTPAGQTEIINTDPNALAPVTPEIQASFQPRGPIQNINPPAPISSYTGPSIVDYLNSIGQPSDIRSRKALADSLGIPYNIGATGIESGKQNTLLLNTLRRNQPPEQPISPPIQPQKKTEALAPAIQKPLAITSPINTITSAQSPEAVVQQISSAFGIDTYTKQINDLETELQDKIIEVNNNPWISEGLRSKKVIQIQEKYENKKKTLIDTLRLQQDAVGQALNVYFKEKELAQTRYLKELDLKSKAQDDELRNELLEAQIRATEALTEQRGRIGTGVGDNSLTSSILAFPRLYNDLSANQKAEIIPELQALGFEFPRQISPSQQEAQVGAQSALLALSILERNIYDKNGSLNRTALVSAATGVGGTATARRELVDVITRIRTGAALTANEEAFYKKQSPNITDTAESARQKLNQLTVLFAGIAGSPVILRSNKGQMFEYNDMFDPKQRNEVRQLISSGYNIASY